MTPPGLRLLADWAGPVHCRAYYGALSLSAGTRGESRGELIFAGAVPMSSTEERLPSNDERWPPPATLHDVKINELATSTPISPTHLYRIDSREGRFVLCARSLQRHSGVAEAFEAAVPPMRVPALTRLGWTLLLWLLRLPGAARLLRRSGRGA